MDCLLSEKAFSHYSEIPVGNSQNEEAKFSRHSEPEWAVATALFRECHRATGALTVGTLTCTVNEILSRIG